MGAMNYINAGFAFGGTLEAGRSKSNALKYNEEVATNQADTVHQQGVAAGEALDRSVRQSMGAAHAAYGGSGVSMDVGSPMTALADATRQGTLDKLTSKYNFNTKETAYRDQAKLYRIGAENAIRQALVAAIENGGSAMMGGAVSNDPSSFGGSNYGKSSGLLNGSAENGGIYAGPGSTSTSWAGESGNQWSGGNSLTGGEYTGDGSTSVSWPGSDSGSWM